MRADPAVADPSVDQLLSRLPGHLSGQLVTGGPFDPVYAHMLRAPGKRLRAGMVLACTQLLPDSRSIGVSTGDALDMACAVEMLHEASLMHDDVCDGSVLRRDRPSVPAAYGVRAAANAGFHLAGHALHVLAGVIERNLALVSAVAGDHRITFVDGISELSFGQLIETLPPDLDFPSLRRHYRTVAAAKTGTLFRLACSYGGAGGGCDADQIVELMTFADALAIGFQIMDDVRDIEGGPGLGKDAGSDLNRLVPTWPVIEWLALRGQTPAGWQAAASQERTAREIDEICADLVASGATARARQVAADEIDAARLALAGFGDQPGTRYLLALCDRVVAS